MGKKNPREEHREHLTSLRKNTLKKVDYHLQKALVDKEDFYSLVRKFFLDLLQKEYEATYEEIIKEIEEFEHDYMSFSDQDQKDIRELLEFLSEHEYHAPKNPTQEQMRQLLLTFRQIMAKLTTFRESTIDLELRKGRQLIEEGKFGQAEDAYHKALFLYDKLPQEEQKEYFHEVQSFFQLLSKQKGHKTTDHP